MSIPPFDAASSQTGSSVSSISWTHTTTASGNRILLVGVSASGITGPTGVTYNGVSMTQIGSTVADGNNFNSVTLWYLTAPATGANTVAVTFAASHNIVAGAVTFSNASQSAPSGSNSHSGSNTTSSSDTVTTTTSQVVVDVVVAGVSPTVGGSQTQRWGTSSTVFGAGSTQAGGASSTAMAWSAGSNTNWAQLAIPITFSQAATHSSICDGYGGTFS